MEAIIKVISVFIGLFAIANGVWVAWQPPYGDEPIGYTIIIIGVLIPLVTLYIGGISDRRYD